MKINYKIIIFILMLLPQLLFAKEEQLGSVESICQSYRGEDDFLTTASNKILKYNERRIELVHLMSNGKALGCQQALTDYLTHFNAPEFFKKKPFGFESYLILAYSANLPVAKKLLKMKLMQDVCLIGWIFFKNSMKKLIIKVFLNGLNDLLYYYEILITLKH